jgi:16S rRNA processing protein RimM
MVVIGKITSVYGVKGWVKVHSYTEPMENILGYQSCYIDRGSRWDPLDFKAIKHHGKGFVALIDGLSDRDKAQHYCQCNIAIPLSEIPVLKDGEFYWRELKGLKVFAIRPDEEELLLGTVHEMMETGANDVLVVRQSKGSIDKRERLIPWLPEQVIITVDIDAGSIRVDWDIEF